jgi:hypothetical protein
MNPDIIHALEIAAIVVAGTLTGSELAVAVFFHPRISRFEDAVHIQAAQTLAKGSRSNFHERENFNHALFLWHFSPGDKIENCSAQFLAVSILTMKCAVAQLVEQLICNSRTLFCACFHSVAQRCGR